MLGPHKNLELVLLLLGKKHCAMIPQHQYDSAWLVAVAELGLYTQPVATMGGQPDIGITLPGHEWRIRKVASIYAGCRLKSRMDLLDHARLGLLFSYSKGSIREFLDLKESRYVA